MAGVPSVKVLSLLLWNVLKLSMHAFTKTIGFADDLADVIVAIYLEKVTKTAKKLRLFR